MNDSAGWKMFGLGASVFVVVVLISGWTVAGPGLTWDEPAYRYSQIRLQQWWQAFGEAESATERAELLSADAIDFYFEYNRRGPNFHPPMAGYLNLGAYAVFSRWIDDLSARRLASSFELALTAAVIAWFMGSRYGLWVGLTSGFSLALMPRVFGHSHIAGTDTPLMMFWVLAALSAWMGLSDRRAQWAAALASAGLFLVKFNGAVVAVPITAAFVVWCLASTGRHVVRWLAWSALVFVPIAPLWITILLGSSAEADSGLLASLAQSGMANAELLRWLFLWPIFVWTIHRFVRRRSDWPVGLELPWVIAAVTPVLVIVANPTWWHDPVRSLSAYVDLNLGRKDYLPDISIFYWGRQYLYSLPWHNAWVLMALTIPPGLLLLGSLGALRAIVAMRRDAVPIYLLLHAVTLPFCRMFPVPAHDGVRLFLPTFAFWGALVGLGSALIAARVPGRWIWPILLVLGPGWGAMEIARDHPYELSYYSIGLERAQRAGFEVTYWYDAVTDDVLDDLNEQLPAGAVLGFPSPSINPEVFVEHQSKGRLRGDVELDVSKAEGFPYMLLLTHSSKATPFTRLLYAVTPWYASTHQGVRLFSVVDPEGVARAWALHALTVEIVASSDGRPVSRPNARILAARPEQLRQLRESLGRSPGTLDAETRASFEQLAPGGRISADLARVLSVNPDAVQQAVEMILGRGDAIRELIEMEGYPVIEDVGGYLDSKRAPDAASNP